MDREDAMYLAAAALIGIGAGTFSVGAGLICFGAMLAISPLVSMLRSGGKNK